MGGAADILIFEMVASFARQPGVQVGLLVVEREGDSAGTPVATDAIRQAIGELRSLGVDVLEPVTLAAPGRRRGPLARVLRPRMTDHFPEMEQSARVEAAVMQFNPDVVVVALSEWLTATMCGIQVPKFAYYGNPDPKNRRASIEIQRRAGELGKLAELYAESWVKRFERIHLDGLRAFEWLGDVSANDAAYYAEHGHPNAFYVRHMWIEPRHAWRRTRGADGVARFIANVGWLRATANTFGLEYLCTEMLPAMRRVFAGHPFELHVLGRGDPHPRLAPLLRAPEIVLRGYVDDIDQEIVNADAFLCVNNATEYKVGHTRYLHAWSLGACVIGHRDASLSIPEMADGENALLGGDARGIAEYLWSAAADPALRARIGAGGRDTFVRDFTGSQVVPQLLDRIRLRP